MKGLSVLSNLIRTSSLLLVILSVAISGFAQEKKESKKKEESVVISSPIKLPAEYDAAAWKKFESDHGGFSVMLPGTPQEETQTLQIGEHTVPVRVLKFNALANYNVMYLDIPVEHAGNVEATRKLLDSFARKAFEVFRATSLQQKEITLDGHPGLFAMLRLPEGFILRQRVYAVRGRLYQLMITTPPEPRATDDQRRFYEATANKFLDSFTLAPAIHRAPARSAEGGASETSAPPPPAPKKLPRAPISGGIIDSKAISKPAPAYPAAAKEAGVWGTVEVFVVVDEQGKVIKAEAVRGPVQLREAAVEAARKARLSPVRLSGELVKYSGLLTYNFRLR
jgi:TonB family protein